MWGFLQWTVALALTSSTVLARTRTYYVGVVEEVWDYAPGGGDLSSYQADEDGSALHQESDWETFLEPGQERIGRKYMKALYREFTDATFSVQVQRRPWLGVLGPILVSEEGDVVRVVFKNMAHIAGRNFSIHPHGAQYTKENEGALYMDGTSGAMKQDEGVSPGQVYTVEWQITHDSSPTLSDPDCLTWTYHSHVNTVRDVSSGLIGILLTCKPGAVNKMERSNNTQFAVMLDVIDENESWYIDYNIQTYLPLLPPASHDTLKEDEDFTESNLMHGINGRVYGHLQGLDVCVGSTIDWHLVGFGNEVDIHSLSVSGHSFLNNQHRVDAIGLNPVEFVTATMEVQFAGKWRVKCSVNDHIQAGMVALLNARDCGNNKNTSLEIERVVNYYIAIEEVDWNYAPTLSNLFDGGPLLTPGSASERYFKRDGSHLGGVYRKAVFRQYKDSSFSQQVIRGPEEEHLGFLGPVLRLQVGDAVTLTLKNKASQPFSIHPHGATFVKDSEGALYNDGTFGLDHADDYVPPAGTQSSAWLVNDDMGPGPMDPPCITRIYTSSSRDYVRDTYSGLVGPILVCRKGVLDSNGRQRQVDREFFLLLSVMDENLSWYNQINSQGLQVHPDDEELYESNLMHGMNGYSYGNLPGLETCVDDRVVWHVFSVGTERDVHSLYIHGQPITHLDLHRSSVYLLPGYFRTLLMKAQNTGEWAVVCQTFDHYEAGTKALLKVQDCGMKRDYSAQYGSGTHRYYFLQAEEEDWDYAPSGMDLISGRNLSEPDADAYIFTRSDGPYLGKVYKKARYHQYTDGSFSTKVQRKPEDQYLGVLGPVLWAEAHDNVTVVFRNNASRPYSIHAQGLLYKKSSEGAPYGTNSGGAVQPGETTVYEWEVTPDFAPAEGDPECINQAYYSAVDPVKDINSGLIGPIIICKPGTLDKTTGVPQHVDKSFVVLFEVIDEARTWYVDDNIRRFGTTTSKDDPDFGESCLMHSINGYVYGNNPPMEIPQNGAVDWHLMALGNEVDIHSTHFHGNQVVAWETGRHTRDVIQLFPGIFETVRMNATMAGQWLLHCHVHDHLSAGMETTYIVLEA